MVFQWFVITTDCVWVYNFSFAGVDLISGVSCEAPYEWVDRTNSGWDFNFSGRNEETFLVCISHVDFV